MHDGGRHDGHVADARHRRALFILFNASVNFEPVMTPEDLAKSGLDELGKKYA